MEEQEADVIFRKLANILEQQGLDWVVAQVLDQVRLGHTKRESVPIEQLELRDALLSTPIRRRGSRKEELIKTLPYSRVARLRLLLDGIDRAVIQTSEMESACLDFFQSERSADVHFIPDEEEAGQREKSIRLGEDIAGRKTGREELRHLIAELRKQLDAD